MVFYLIGLGLDKESVSANALKVLKSCDKIYLESYTVNFPYSKSELEDSIRKSLSFLGGRETREKNDREIGISLISLDREKVEDESIVSQAKEKNIALLVYGDPLSATTHTQLILACKKQEINCQIFHNASIMTSIAKTGLQPYKFGKTTSIPFENENIEVPYDVLISNQKKCP